MPQFMGPPCVTPWPGHGFGSLLSAIMMIGHRASSLAVVGSTDGPAHRRTIEDGCSPCTFLFPFGEPTFEDGFALSAFVFSDALLASTLRVLVT